MKKLCAILLAVAIFSLGSVLVVQSSHKANNNASIESADQEEFDKQVEEMSRRIGKMSSEEFDQFVTDLFQNVEPEVQSADVVQRKNNSIAIFKPQSWKEWYRYNYLADYLPRWMQSWIPRARIREMFVDTVSYILKIHSGVAKSEIDNLAQKYIKWIDQYKDIINETSFVSQIAIQTGSPDSLLGLWKSRRLGMQIAKIENKDESEMFFNSLNNAIDGITQIIKHLEELGAQLTPMEKFNEDQLKNIIL
jgi:hypothetical protein